MNAAPLALGAFMVYLAFLAPTNYAIDGNSMLALARSIAQRSDMAVEPGLGMVGGDGRTYSSWYPLQSVLAAPLVAAGTAVAVWFRLPPPFVETMIALLIPALCTALTLPLIARVGVLLGGTPRGAWTAAVVYGFGTIALVYARTFFAEPLLALLVTAAACLAMQQRARGWTACLCALSVLAKPTGILVGPILSAYLLARTRRVGEAAPPVLGSAIGLAIYGAYNYARFGNPFTFGHPWEFSLGNVPTGALGLLFSPGFGLLWFCPWMAVAIVGARRAARQKPLETAAVLGLLLAFIGLHACWRIWSGGWSWGPRLLLPALPCAMAATATVTGRLRTALVGSGIVTCLLTLPTLGVFYERVFAEAGERGFSADQIAWTPVESPLILLWPAARRQLDEALAVDVPTLVAQEGVARTPLTARAMRIVTLWWWFLPVAGVPRAAGAAAAAALAGCGACLVAWSRPRDTGTHLGAPDEPRAGVTPPSIATG